MQPASQTADSTPRYNLNLALGSESAVDCSSSSTSSSTSVNSGTSRRAQFGSVVGNVWQWTEDDFSPLPGFVAHAYYADFSTPFFKGEHKLLVGGCFASTGDQASVFNRTPFRPHFLQHSGFRMACGM